MSNPITPLSPDQVAKQEHDVPKEGYVHRVLVAFDQFMNVAVFNGHADETISAHSARAAEQGKTWGIAMSKFLNLFQKDHGPDAQAGDVERAKIVEQFENQSGGFIAK
jgi:hypothetical protein